MCRIVGLIDNQKYGGLNNSDKEILSAMRDAMSKGGPDGAGIYIDRNLGLGHRRLAIIDLSDAGIQPLQFDNWIISFNGEIYNYEEVKKELLSAGYVFSTGTDTEVIVKSIDCWGPHAVNKFHGMFAFALWNKQTETLLLCRDRLGVKPLYWYLKDGLLMFASEVKAFHQHPDFDKKIDIDAVPHYLQKGYIHPSRSIFAYVKQVKPGTFLRVDKGLVISEERYWSIEESYAAAKTDNRSEDEITEELEKVLSESFKFRMVSDVPVGIFLSGGIDSSLVAALLQKDAAIPIQTFTIGFEDAAFDESEVAERVAAVLGTNHKTYYCSEEDFKEIIPLLPTIYDEPFGDSSAIPTIIVSRMARQKVKVVLSGDGGDELFGGYSKYHFSTYSPYILSTPLFIRNLVYKLSYKISPQNIESFARKIGINSYSQIGNKYHKFRQTLLAGSVDDLFEISSSYLSKEELSQLTNKPPAKDYAKKSIDSDRMITYLGMKDMHSYLPGDILTKVDRASMSVGLEAREPFLDQHVIEFSMTIPDIFKYDKKGKGKYLLKRILKKYLPAEIIDRPKQGFSIPTEQWMKSILLDNILAIKSDSDFFQKFNLNKAVCNSFIDSFFNNKNRINPQEIWFIYCLFQWYKKWL
jgi:asparagine synthase (glutamine-hydrolysing)